MPDARRELSAYLAHLHQIGAISQREAIEALMYYDNSHAQPKYIPASRPIYPSHEAVKSMPLAEYAELREKLVANLGAHVPHDLRCTLHGRRGCTECFVGPHGFEKPITPQVKQLPAKREIFTDKPVFPAELESEVAPLIEASGLTEAECRDMLRKSWEQLQPPKQAPTVDQISRRAALAITTCITFLMASVCLLLTLVAVLFYNDTQMGIALLSLGGGFLTSSLACISLARSRCGIR